MNKTIRKKLNELKNASYIQLYVAEQLLKARENRFYYKNPATPHALFLDGYITAMGEILDVLKEDDNENTKRSEADRT